MIAFLDYYFASEGHLIDRLQLHRIPYAAELESAERRQHSLLRQQAEIRAAKDHDPLGLPSVTCAFFV